MLIENILIIGIGILFGVITGLIPGIHINLISTLILVNISYFSQILELNQLILFIISMSVVHTYIDFIPSILFGVPDSADSALAVLPGHEMIMKGEGYKAIYLSSIGSLLGIPLTIIFGSVFFFILNKIYNNLGPYVPYILAIMIITLIMQERSLNAKFWSITITLFSGGYGLIILNSRFISEPLFLIFTSIFGISAIINSLNDNTKLPKQNFNNEVVISKAFLKGLFTGGFAASICSILPGIGNSQAVILAKLLIKDISREIFIVILGSINTINFLLSIITFYLINRARNGSIVAISQFVTEFAFEDLIFYFMIASIVGIIAFFLTLFLGKICIKTIDKINYKLFNWTILISLIIISFIMQKWIGLLVISCGTCLGLLCINLGVRRIHLMSVLTIPIIFNLI